MRALYGKCAFVSDVVSWSHIRAILRMALDLAEAGLFEAAAIRDGRAAMRLVMSSASVCTPLALSLTLSIASAAPESSYMPQMIAG